MKHIAVVTETRQDRAKRSNVVEETRVKLDIGQKSRINIVIYHIC